MRKEVCTLKAYNIDAHAKYDQKRRGRKGQVGKCLPAIPQSPFFLGKIWLTSSKINHSYAEAFSVSLSARGIEDDTHLTVDRTGSVESDHV